MKSHLLRYATPLITGLFLVSLISGLGLFFHFGPSGFHSMHEILSLVLVVPFVLHLWKNWRAMITYFKHRPMIIGLALSAVTAGFFLIPTGNAEGGRPMPSQFAVAAQIMTQPLVEVAPIYDQTSDELTAALTAAGYTISSPDQSLSDIAAASGKADTDLQAVLNAL